MTGRMALGIVAGLIVFVAFADQIAVPHQFSPGTPARSAEVNENFAALTSESNGQDQRISALEGASRVVSSQMICGGPAIHLNSLLCVRSASPNSNQILTYAEIVGEGWEVASVAGSATEQVLLLNQYVVD